MAGIETPAVANFLQRGICMVPAIQPVIAFLALVVWRFVFAGPRRGPLARAIAPQQQRYSHLLEEGLHISDPGSVAVIADNQLENNAGGLHRLDRKDPAKIYLQRIAALTGATQMGNS